MLNVYKHLAFTCQMFINTLPVYLPDVLKYISNTGQLFINA